MRSLSLLMLACLLMTGCTLVPQWIHEPRVHNPFPQLGRVAILPFGNQSDDPTVNGLEVASAYRSELQKIRGFEVVPMGVVQRFLIEQKIEIHSQTDFHALAEQLGVDAVIIGAVTDYQAYYPPRLGIATAWYAANRCFHPIPPGYGLPWGTSEEEFIPDDLVFEAEFALAQQQLKTQTPEPTPPTPVVTSTTGSPGKLPHDDPQTVGQDHGLPADWPDPRGFIPPPPQPHPPACTPHSGPIMNLVRQYEGNDAEFTERLANYYQFRDEARFGGWRSYLERSDDFIRFCCYLHITELLTARGGASETRVVLRWPIDRYER